MAGTLAASGLSVRGDAASTPDAAYGAEALFFPVIYPRRRGVVIRRQHVRRHVNLPRR